MKKMLNVMLNVQKDMALEKDAIEVELEIVSGVLEETINILQVLISEGEFEEAKGLLDDCSSLRQEQEELEILLSNKKGDYSALECMIEQTKRLIAKYETDSAEPEEDTSSLEDVLAALAFLVMK